MLAMHGRRFIAGGSAAPRRAGVALGDAADAAGGAAALLGALVVNFAGLSRRIVVLGFFGLFGAGLAVLGAGAWRAEGRG